MDACAEPREAKPLTHRQTRLIVIGVLLPTFMGSLDQTILATALPTIGQDFDDLRSLPWLITAYLLASTAIIPLYGKIADIHGRRVTLHISILAYMAGSLLCALAPSMLVLIFGRVLHGLGGGGLSSMGMIVLGDLVSPKERGRYYGYFAAAYTTAGGSGPLLGGLIADHLHWSVIFWINIPMGLMALAITASLLRRLPRYERPHRLDVIGAALIVIASVAFMLALNAGRDGWTLPPILALFSVALVVGALFVLRLLSAPEPLIPIAVLKDPIVCLAIAANACCWGSVIGLNVFLPMYLQGVLGFSPSNAGLSLMVFMVALNTSAGLAGQVLGRVRHYKRLPMVALSLSIAAVATLGWQAQAMTPLSFELTLIVIGAGFGPIPALTAVAMQNVVARHQLGISVGAMNFTRNLYATMLIAAFGAIVLGAAGAGQSLGSAIGAGDGDAAQAFSRVFFAAAASMTAALIAIAVMAEKPLRTGAEPDAQE